MVKLRKKYIVLTLLTLFTLYGICIASPIDIGEKVPNTTLKDIHGQSFSLKSIIGKHPTVIWITDFASSDVEGIDDFNRIIAEYPQIKFIIISTVPKKEVQKVLNQYDVQGKILMGGEDTLTKALSGESGYGISPIYNFFIIDKKGILKQRTHFPGMNPKRLKGLIESIL